MLLTFFFRACGGQNHNVLSFMLVYRASLDKHKTLGFASLAASQNHCVFYFHDCLQDASRQAENSEFCSLQARKKTLEEFAIDTSPGNGISGNKHVSQNFQHDFIFVIGAQRMTL